MMAMATVIVGEILSISPKISRENLGIYFSDKLFSMILKSFIFHGEFEKIDFSTKSFNLSGNDRVEITKFTFL